MGGGARVLGWTRVRLFRNEMGGAVRTIADVIARLLAAMPEAVAFAVLRDEAEAMAADVRAELGRAPGVDAAFPARRSGALADSIGVSVDGGDVVIGSTSEVAVYQERGTARMVPRAFLAPVGVASGSAAAEAVGAAVVAVLRGA